MKQDDLPLGMARLVRNYSTYSVVLAGLVTFWAWAGWGFPFVMAKDYAADKVTIEGRLEKIEAALGTLSAGQMEAQELQLQARVQDLERELAKTKEEPLKVILERQKNEAEQGLTKIRRALYQTRNTGAR